MSAREVLGTAPKKAAKKVAKKAAKKVAKKAAKKTAKGPGHDARRAYEHLHRLRALKPLLAPPILDQLQTLTRYARASFVAENPRVAADLLRAGEHLAFGSLSESSGEASQELKQAIEDEYEHLLDRAAAHWDRSASAPRALKTIYNGMRSEARSAWKVKAFHRALEYARGADALAHAAPAELQLRAGDESEGLLLSPEM